jgi:enoyl-CoA hydratase/carnithine racemase
MNKNNVVYENLPESLKVRMDGEILFVTLDRPAKRNALNEATMKGLEKIFTNIPTHIRCAILHSSGEHFSAGLDLSELKERNTFEGIQHSAMWYRAMDAIQFGKVPAIAVIHGACFGGGLELASACHIRVAEASAIYALPEGQRGIFVGGGGSVRLPKLIGAARMTDLMLTGRVYSAEDGNVAGISQYLTKNGEGLNTAIELSKKVAQNAEITNYAVMHVLPRIVDAPREHGLMMESLIAAISQDSPEAKERMATFLNGKAKKIVEKKS